MSDPPVDHTITNGERSPLLQRESHHIESNRKYYSLAKTAAYGVSIVVFLVVFITLCFYYERIGDAIGGLPTDPEKAAKLLLQGSPVIVSCRSGSHSKAV